MFALFISLIAIFFAFILLGWKIFLGVFLFLFANNLGIKYNK